MAEIEKVKAEPKKSEPEPKTTVKMKFMGHFRGTEKRVALPIPLIANSQKLDKELAFTRSSDRTGPAFCQVPLEWAGALLAVGGNWQLDEKLTPELKAHLDAAKAECDAKMEAFVRDNEMVEV